MSNYGKKYFTSEQIEQLVRNKYVKNVSEKAITYTEEFKEIFPLEYSVHLNYIIVYDDIKVVLYSQL